MASVMFAEGTSFMALPLKEATDPVTASFSAYHIRSQQLHLFIFFSYCIFLTCEYAMPEGNKVIAKNNAALLLLLK
ncbi:hypothetical protein EJ377_01415 [Chryseobacterium arthrosphaerae]|uniref:Uncharacterized protein n=1 Tax=Chryseobacterium arthrosphaerae TaxID=651561 RepID=A0A432DYP8_9FLAO|nr:hypothetical protein EJ377_01415 [Chryseobacterium arthrosphaerae]